MIKQYIVVVHLPHKSIVVPFSNKQKAEYYFDVKLQECCRKYGWVDVNGSTYTHAMEFKYYEVYKGYYIQLYEAILDQEEEIPWI